MSATSSFSQDRAFAGLRIVFGLVWAVDAFFKWTPSFLNGLPGMISSMAQGQSGFMLHWINFWTSVISVSPHLFAVLVALIESAIALGLIFNLFPKTVYISGFVFSIVIWCVGECCGGPYGAGSTDIGAAVMYSFVFAALYFQRFGISAASTAILLEKEA